MLRCIQSSSSAPDPVCQQGVLLALGCSTSIINGMTRYAGTRQWFECCIPLVHMQDPFVLTLCLCDCLCCCDCSSPELAILASHLGMCLTTELDMLTPLRLSALAWVRLISSPVVCLCLCQTMGCQCIGNMLSSDACPAYQHSHTHMSFAHLSCGSTLSMSKRGVTCMQPLLCCCCVVQFLIPPLMIGRLSCVQPQLLLDNRSQLSEWQVVKVHHRRHRMTSACD
jgi:hypothetical protein